MCVCTCAFVLTLTHVHVLPCPIAPFRARAQSCADVKVWKDNAQQSRGGDERRGCQISIQTPLHWQGHLNSCLLSTFHDQLCRFNKNKNTSFLASSPKATWNPALHHLHEEKNQVKAELHMETLQFLEETASAEPSGTKSARAQRREDHLRIKDRISTELKKKKSFLSSQCKDLHY